MLSCIVWVKVKPLVICCCGSKSHNITGRQTQVAMYLLFCRNGVAVWKWQQEWSHCWTTHRVTAAWWSSGSIWQGRHHVAASLYLHPQTLHRDYYDSLKYNLRGDVGDRTTSKWFPCLVSLQREKNTQKLPISWWLCRKGERLASCGLSESFLSNSDIKISAGFTLWMEILKIETHKQEAAAMMELS